MKILGVSQSTQTNFGMSKVRIPQTDGSTLRFEIVSKPNAKITKIFGDVMRKCKVINQFTYTNRKGFNDEELAEIFEKLCQNATDKEEASFKIIEYMVKNIDYEA